MIRNLPVTQLPGPAFGALADPTRRRILDLLRGGTWPAGQIARAFPLTRPAISKHLRLLRRARLVVERRVGRHRVYQLTADPLREVDAWLAPYRQFWAASLADLKAFVESGSPSAPSAPAPRAKSTRTKRAR